MQALCKPCASLALARVPLVWRPHSWQLRLTKYINFIARSGSPWAGDNPPPSRDSPPWSGEPPVSGPQSCQDFFKVCLTNYLKIEKTRIFFVLSVFLLETPRTRPALQYGRVKNGLHFLMILFFDKTLFFCIFYDEIR